MAANHLRPHEPGAGWRSYYGLLFEAEGGQRQLANAYDARVPTALKVPEREVYFEYAQSPADFKYSG